MGSPIRYTWCMEPHTGWRRFLAPLNIAAYITWFAVVISVWARRPATPAWFGLPARAAPMALLVLFLVGFLITTSRAVANDHATAHRGLVVMAIATLGLLMTHSLNTTPVLIVVFASVAMATVTAREAVLWLAALNAAFVAALLVGSSLTTASITFTIYAGFQAFAAFASLAMRRANEAATALREVNANLLATRSLLSESARDSERLRLSRELHDISGHKLTALKLNLALLAHDPAIAARQEFATAQSLASELLSDLRTVVSQLRRHDGIDLKGAFERLAEVLPTPRVHIAVADGARLDDADRAESLLRIAQESVTNAARHAGARNVWVKLARSGDHLDLTIDDDGRGAESLGGGHGIASMHERVAALGGTLDLGASARGGLRVLARVPRLRVA